MDSVGTDFPCDADWLKELKEFIGLAKQDYYLAEAPPKKMNKRETVEHNFQKECQDSDSDP